MRRALLIAAGCLSVAPAASAATTTRDLPRGAVILGYSGEARRTIPTSAYCHGTNPCVDYGQDEVDATWHVTVLFNRHGVSGARDTLLEAEAHHAYDAEHGQPAAAAGSVPYPPCRVTVHDANGRYARGAFMTPGATSLGFQMSLPIDSQWMQRLDETDPRNCRWGGDYTGTGVFGAASYGPTSAADRKDLGLATNPQFAMRRRSGATRKHFDFHYEADNAADGSGPLTTIDITSTVTVISGCRRVYMPAHICVDRY
jgi:hypothetical protein